MKAQNKWSTFFKISLILMVSILLTNFITLLSSDYITKNLFIQTSTFLNSSLMDKILEKIETSHLERQYLVRELEINPALRNYFDSSSWEQNSRGRFMLTYDLHGVFKSCFPTDDWPAVTAVSDEGKAFVFSGGWLLEEPDQIRERLQGDGPLTPSRRLSYSFWERGITSEFETTGCVIASRQMFLPASSESFGTIYITIPEAEFYQMFSDAVPSGSQMYLISSDGHMVSGSDKKRLGSLMEPMLKQAKQMQKEGRRYINTSHGGRREILISQYILELDLYMVNVVEEAMLLRDYGGIRRSIFLSGFLITGVAVAAVYLLMRRIASPLNFFVRQLENMKEGKFERVQITKGSAEVNQMENVYNRMVDEIDRYVDRLMEEQERSRRHEIEALQMQINPHFMYNTLASIKYLLWGGRQEEASDMITALITILKKTIGSMDAEITLREETELLKQYVYINQIRYGDGIRMDFFLSEECMECRVPKLVLQPFIENAFFHAFQDKKEGTIRIFSRRQKEDLVCEIIDDGDGMPEEAVDQLLNVDSRRHFSGIGIPNVHERLRIMYGEAYGVTIHSVEGQGTSVLIRMPFS